MGGTGVIDRFLAVFTQYIDSGFGLLQPEVAFVATTLIAIDITLAALFWSWSGDDDIIARLVKKTLFVGVFAYLIGNWNNLARIIFESFSGLGLKAAGSALSAADFLRPGRVAQVGLDAGRPLLDSISGLMGYISFLENFIQIMVLLFAWVMVLLAFFILAIQLFVTLIEFKLTTLAGFVLIPFGLFGKSAFMAERVLGNVNLVRHQGTGARRHRRHRLDVVFAVYVGDDGHPTVDRRRRGDGARRTLTARPRHFRTWHRQWSCVRRSAARRGRRRGCCRGRGWRRRSRIGWWRHGSGGTCRGRRNGGRSCAR
jgi:hypothetical protein